MSAWKRWTLAERTGFVVIATILSPIAVSFVVASLPIWVLCWFSLKLEELFERGS
jgi:hypothetical protein